jgi:hypothetical protein
MNRLCTAVIATISVYCVAGAVASNSDGSARDHVFPTFTADIALPITQTLNSDRDRAYASTSEAETSVATNTANADVAGSAAKSPLQAAPAGASPKAIRYQTAASGRAGVGRYPAEAAANGRFAAPSGIEEHWHEPDRLAVIGEPMSTRSGCANVKWSQPDAAGVPVLLCD